MEIKFHPEATSHKHRPEKFFTDYVVPKLLEERLVSALDIGSGEFCRHSVYLARKGFEVEIVEVPKQVEKMDKRVLEEHCIRVHTEIPERKYDAVLLNYVLNVIPDPGERKAALKKSVEAASKYLMVSVRGPAFIRFFCKDAERYNDGYILARDGMKTFNTAWSKEEIVNILTAEGLSIAGYDGNDVSMQFLCGKLR